MRLRLDVANLTQLSIRTTFKKVFKISNNQRSGKKMSSRLQCTSTLQCPYFPGYKFHRIYVPSPRRMAEKYTIKAWKRPVSRSYEFNLQVGENYYRHFTDYLDVKNSYGVAEIPGALTYT